jgi:transposase-like protein
LTTKQHDRDILHITMGIEETLRRRPDIPDDEVQEIIARAAKLQDDDAPSIESLASDADVVAVAKELDIESHHVEAAIAQWREEKKAKPELEAHTRIKSRGRAMMRWAAATLLILGILGTAAAVGSVAAFGWAGLAGIGAAAVAGIAFVLWLIN